MTAHCPKHGAALVDVISDAACHELAFGGPFARVPVPEAICPVCVPVEQVSIVRNLWRRKENPA